MDFLKRDDKVVESEEKRATAQTTATARAAVRAGDKGDFIVMREELVKEVGQNGSAVDDDVICGTKTRGFERSNSEKMGDAGSIGITWKN